MTAAAPPSQMPEWLRSDDSQTARTLKTSNLYCSQYPRWGLVLVRTTYGDDSSWDLALQRMRQYLQMSLVENDGKQGDGSDDPTIQMAMRMFKPAIIEDADKLDGADFDTIREHYRGWVDEQSGTLETTRVRRGVCLFIDEDLMRRLVEAPEPTLEWWHSGTASSLKVQLELSVGGLDPEFDGGPDQPGGLDYEEHNYQFYHGWMWVSVGSLLRLWKDVHSHPESMGEICPRADRDGLIPIYDGGDGMFLDAETMQPYASE